MAAAPPKMGLGQEACRYTPAKLQVTEQGADHAGGPVRGAGGDAEIRG